MINLFKNIFSKAPAEKNTKSFPDVRHMHQNQFSVPRASHSGYDTVAEQLEAYALLVWVYVCIAKISRVASTLPFVLVDRKTQEPLPDTHEAVQLFNNPNPEQSMAEVWEAAMANYLLTGNGYFMLTFFDKQLNTFPIEIYPGSPQYISPVIGKTSIVDHYIYEVNGIKTPLPKEEIVQFRMFNPLNIALGQSPLAPLAQTIHLGDAAMNINTEYFDNAFMPQVFLSAEGNVDDATFERLKHEMKERTGGTDKRYAPFYSEGLRYDFKDSPIKDMQFEQLMQVAKQGTLATYGVPPAVVGDFKESKSMASVAEQWLSFYDSTVIPFIKYYADTTNKGLIHPIYPDVDGYFDTSAVRYLKESEADKKSKSERVVSLVSTEIITTDEGREILGLQPKADAEGKSKGFDFEAGIDEVQKSRDASRDLIVLATKDGIADLEDGASHVFQLQLDQILDNITAIDQKSFDIIKKTWKEFGSADVDDVFGDWNWNKEWSDATSETLASMIITGASFGFSEAGVTDTLSPATIRRNVAALSKHIVGADDTTKDSVTRTILKGLSENKDLNQIRTDVRTKFRRWQGDERAVEQLPKIQVWRARTIAQTEAYSGFNGGKKEGWQKGDPNNDFEKSWTISGINTRDAHHAVANTRAKHGEFFYPDSEPMLYPGDPLGSAANVINCHCTTTYVRSR